MNYAVIYMHTNRINGKSYIGFALGLDGLERRWKDHISKSRQGSNFAFHQAILKYGTECWDHIKLCQVEHEDYNECIKLAKSLEIEWIAKEKTFLIEYPEKGYNLTPGGDGGYNLGREPWNKGLKNPYSQEHVEFLRKIATGRKTFLGKQHTEETKEKIRKSSKGKSRGKGKKLTDAHKKKISDSSKGKIFSEEAKEKMKNSHIGKKGKCKICGLFGHYAKTCKVDSQ